MQKTANKPTYSVTLYRRQRQIVEFISQFIQRNGYSPTLREIATAMNLTSLATIHEHISSLVKKGVLKRASGNKTRSIILVDDKIGPSKQSVQLPILGYFTNGQAIDPYSETDAYIQVPAEIFPAKKRGFIFQVKSDNMINEGIIDGDYLIIEENIEINDGDIVVAILENNIAILRKLFRESTRVRLESIRSDNSPLYAARIQIQGKCLGTLRHFIKPIH